MQKALENNRGQVGRGSRHLGEFSACCNFCLGEAQSGPLGEVKGTKKLAKRTRIRTASTTAAGM